MAETKVGEITHYFGHIGVAIVKLKKPLTQGDEIRLKGHTSDFKQAVESMQLDHADIKEAGAGDEIGIKVSEKVREGDEVFKVA